MIQSYKLRSYVRYEKLHQYIISGTINGTLRFKFSGRKIVYYADSLTNGMLRISHNILEMLLIVSCNNKIWSEEGKENLI